VQNYINLCGRFLDCPSRLKQTHIDGSLPQVCLHLRGIKATESEFQLAYRRRQVLTCKLNNLIDAVGKLPNW